MKIAELNINGTVYLCVVTAYEKTRIEAGHFVNIPVSRRVAKRPGIPLAIQLSNAGLAAPPVVF